MESSLTFRISELGPRSASTKALLPFSHLDGSDVVIHCPRDAGDTLNEKLVWLWGLLKHKRRALASLQADGATLSCTYQGPVQFELKPNGAEFLHLMGCSLEVR